MCSVNSSAAAGVGEHTESSKSLNGLDHGMSSMGQGALARRATNLQRPLPRSKSSMSNIGTGSGVRSIRLAGTRVASCKSEDDNNVLHALLVNKCQKAQASRAREIISKSSAVGETHAYGTKYNDP